MKIKSSFKNIQVITDDIDDIYNMFILVNIAAEGFSKCHNSRLKIGDIEKFSNLSIYNIVTGITNKVFDKIELNGSIYKFKLHENVEELINVKPNWYTYIPDKIFSMDITGTGMILLINYYSYVGISDYIWLSNELIEYFSNGEQIADILNNLSKCGACEEVVFVYEKYKTSHLVLKTFEQPKTSGKAENKQKQKRPTRRISLI